jgi:hypothetical protein
MGQIAKLPTWCELIHFRIWVLLGLYVLAPDGLADVDAVVRECSLLCSMAGFSTLFLIIAADARVHSRHEKGD